LEAHRPEGGGGSSVHGEIGQGIGHCIVGTKAVPPFVNVELIRRPSRTPVSISEMRGFGDLA
jgi:hypothetical protein